MFIAALLIGILSYSIFFLGIAGLLYKEIIILFTIAFTGSIIVWQRTKIFRKVREIREIGGIGEQKNKSFLLFGALFVTQGMVNLLGALGPELAFDVLWYHLTIPKIWLNNHVISFIPGGLLYYSPMPKLAEMLYLGGLAFGSEIIAKLIHFSFGLLTCLALYKLQRKFFNPVISMLGVVIFYANLVVAWESITAYIDLVRAFFELMALWAFVNWWEKQRRVWLVWSAVMVGLAITTKLLAVGSLVIFVVLIILRGIREIRVIREVGIFLLIALLVPSPWFIFSYLNTGNPVYPFFTNIYKVAPEPLSIYGFIRDIWVLFTQAADPISPLYLIFLPLIALFWGRLGKIREIRLIGLYSLLAIVVWYFTPRTGGGRFILPYLPAFSILVASCVNEILQNKKQYGIFFGRFLIFIVILVSIISIGYRFAANIKYAPVVFGFETKQEFLSNNLNFSFGDFYDADGYFEKNISSSDKVLLIGFHNLYYVNFPYVDTSWLRAEDKFNYIATQKTEPPEQFKDWKLIYSNKKTNVKLYKL